ncbi:MULTISPECIES: hypothetical protein [unclassified Streptomyces]|uniref:hypothetical protein n=1 Tax=unclassified Streptomyces TaxID=2593676 RepID=UPI002E35089C|nr:hypothetical protein [Streptomyces sp. NBC_01268]
MSGAFFTGVQAEGGNVHAGSGPQYIYNFREPTAPGAPPLRPLAEDHLAWLSRRFVPPTGMARARERLRHQGTLLLDALPGSGRNATARMLLHKLTKSRPPRQILPDQDLEADLAGKYLGEGDRLLLDLSEAEQGTWDLVLDRLPSFHQSVRDRRAHLVVVLPHRTHPMSNEVAAWRHTIMRPNGMDLLMRALRCDDPPVVEAPADLPPVVHAYISESPPLRDIARLARLVGEARQANPMEGVESWCAVALRSLHALAPTVQAAVDALTTGPDRALLLATAMLPGARPHVLHHAGVELLRVVGHPADDRPLLEREAMSRQLAAIKASVRPDGSVTFDLPDYAAAVRTHFWTHMPGLWQHLQSWVGQTVQLPSLTSTDRDALVAGYAEQSLRTGQHQALLALAEDWAQRDESRSVQAAVQALGHGLSHPSTGRTFRQKIYSWTKESELPRGLARALVAVSKDVIAISHPFEALVRLHHLARRAGRNLGADRHLLTLVTSDRQLQRSMLDRLARDLTQHTWRADVTLFRACAAPPLLTSPRENRPPLLDRHDVVTALTTAWRALCTRRDEAEWLPQAEEWLSTADEDRRYGDVLLDVLARAAGPDPAVVARLYVLSLPHPCSGRLRRRLDAAQGLRPAR